MSRFRPILLALLLAAPLACKPPFDPKIYPNADKLYQVAMAEYKAGRCDNAAKAFEKLTLDLPARDPRLPLAFYYLAQSQEKTASTCSRRGPTTAWSMLSRRILSSTTRCFSPDERTSGSGGMPELDATYGRSAITAYESLLASYPDSPLRQARAGPARASSMSGSPKRTTTRRTST